MKFTEQDINNIANLAKISISKDDNEKYANELSNIFQLINQMNEINTDSVEPMYNPHDMTLRLRDDTVTEVNQRDRYLALGPKTEQGLYLVPKVIE
jgi:glutamyl-tRNA(Gln) and/or aspartyl-tRNA(Asn) amidotransferase, C subunit